MSTTRVRRPPPPLRRAEVQRVTERSPHLLRVRVAGPELVGLEPGLPAASVRLLVPSHEGDLVMPTWTGNEFLLPSGERPVLRTYTPLHVDPDVGQLDLDVVLHPLGAVSAWARAARRGDPVAISGTGRGYVIDDDAATFVLAGDETAIPAIGQLLDALPSSAPAQALIEVARPDARVDLPVPRGGSLTWLDLPAGASPGDALVRALEVTDLDPGARLWAAGEAAAMQRIRRLVVDARGISRARAHVRGYWKRGRAGDAEGD